MTTPAALQLTPTARDFERNLRAWVAKGSGLDARQVVPGETDGPAPNGLYASLLLLTPRITGLPYFVKELNDDTGMVDQTTVAIARDRYAIQWHRDGATDRGRQFAIWASSSDGLEWATRTNPNIHDWDMATNYVPADGDAGRVLASDGYFYRAVQAGAGHNPVDDDGTYWAQQWQNTPFTLHRVSDIRPLDEVDRGGKWEERVGVEIDISYAQRLVQELNPIEIIDINLYHDDHGGAISQSIEVTT